MTRQQKVNFALQDSFMPYQRRPRSVPGSFVGVLVIILDLILSGLSQSFPKLLVNTSKHFWEGDKAVSSVAESGVRKQTRRKRAIYGTYRTPCPADFES